MATVAELTKRVQRLESLLLGVTPIIPEKELKLSRIRDAVATAHNMTTRALVTDCREPRFAEARFKGFALCRRFTNSSLKEIALVFGLKDHGTVCSGLRRNKELCVLYPDYQRIFKSLEHDLEKEFQTLNA